MIPLPQYKGRTVAVMGLGRSGIATARALAASGAEVWAWDDNEASRHRAEADGVAIIDLMACDWRVPKAMVLSPGIPFHYPAPHPVAALARSAGCAVIGDIELLGKAKGPARLCGVTGTNGKSTTTSLIGHILKDAGIPTEVGGNLGTPALALAPLGSDGVYVIEVSSFQLDLTASIAFDVAVLLNISPDHLYRHGGLDGYIAAKRRIFRNQTTNHVAVIGVDDDYGRAIHVEMRAANGPRALPISSERRVAGGVYALDGILYDDTEGTNAAILKMAEAPRLPGTHNWQNAAATYAAARALGLPRDTVLRGLKTFPGLAHRQELVATIDGVRYVNDSKATNADAAAKALACYRDIYWIAGGRPKEGGIRSLRPWFPRIVHAFLIGEAEADFADTLQGRVPLTRCGNLAVAVAKASEMAHGHGRADSVVLLSPACASFDQWDNFEARGDGFKKLVAALPGAGSNDPGHSHVSGGRAAGGRA